MAPFWGAPPEQLRETETLFSTHALGLEELFIALDGIVLNRSHWSGPDADSFRTHYSATVRPTVDALQTDGLMSSNALGYWDNRGDERSGRRGEGRENTPRNDGDESYDPDEENPNAQYGTPGPAETPKGENGLGEGVPGTDADVDDLIADQPAFAQKAEEARHQAGDDAVAQAQADGATGPVTYPLSTPWGDHTADGDWFYASGSFNYNQTGTVTAYPPDAEHSEWRYEVNTQVNFRDRYNWDGGKSTQIGPVRVSDERLASLHRAGIAREYNLLGESSPEHTEGSVP